MKKNMIVLMIAGMAVMAMTACGRDNLDASIRAYAYEGNNEISGEDVSPDEGISGDDVSPDEESPETEYAETAEENDSLQEEVPVSAEQEEEVVFVKDNDRDQTDSYQYSYSEDEDDPEEMIFLSNNDDTGYSRDTEYQSYDENGNDYGYVYDGDDFKSGGLVTSHWDDFIIGWSDSSRLTESDICRLTPIELTYARNEIYARHGRRFNSTELQDYFDSKWWYTIDDDFEDSDLSALEKANAELIRNYQERTGKTYRPL